MFLAEKKRQQLIEQVSKEDIAKAFKEMQGRRFVLGLVLCTASLFMTGGWSVAIGAPGVVVFLRRALSMERQSSDFGDGGNLNRMLRDDRLLINAAKLAAKRNVATAG